MSKEQWEAVCAEKFNDVLMEQRRQRKSIGEIREKLFNGVAGSAALIPGMGKDMAVMGTKLDMLVKRKGKSTKGIAKQRGAEVAIMALIVSAVSNWDAIVSFIQRLLN